MTFRSVLHISFLLFWSSIYGFSQQYVSDSTKLKFGNEQHFIPFLVDSVIDARTNLKNNELRISERKKYLYIPVDFYYLCDTSLSVKIQELFLEKRISDSSYTMVIERFELSYSDFKPLPMLIAQISIFKNQQKLGTLVYETPGKKVKKNKEKETFEELISNWRKIFSQDVTAVIRQANLPPYYYSPEKQPKQRIYTAVSYFFDTNNAFTIEGNFGFFDPEPGTRFRRTSNYFLYRNDERFESIAFGRRAFQEYYRITGNLMLGSELHYCLGVNRWKDMYTYNHKLYDIVQLNAGVKGGIYYFPFSKRSFTIGIVAHTDVLYIYSMNLLDRYGLGFSLGLNF